MTSSIGTYERLLNEWRNEEAKVEALKQFQATGGEHRLRMTGKDDEHVAGSLVAAAMEGNGYRAILANAIKVYEGRAAAAKQALLTEAMSEGITSGVEGSK